MSTSRFSQGQRVHPQQPFYFKKREGDGREVDFAFEAFGQHGGVNERKQLEELRAAAGQAASFFVEENLPAVRQQNIAAQRSELFGQIVQEASYLAGIHINRRFLWAKQDGFYLAINALQKGEIEFSTGQIGIVGGSLCVELNAQLNGFRYEQAAAAGGFAAKRVTVNAACEGPLCVIIGGYANFVDFHLEVFGSRQGQVEVHQTGEPKGKMLGRHLRASDLLTNDGGRVITVSDEALTD